MQRWFGLTRSFAVFAGFILVLATGAATAQYQPMKVDLETASGEAWTFTDLYNFTGAPDGYSSTAGLVEDAAGNLYGTTLYGGDLGCGDSGCGVVFELTPGKNGTWTESVLHTFTGQKPDGCYSFAGVILDSAGNLYGTTEGCGGGGWGIVYELSPGVGGKWSEKVLHSFHGGKKDGAYPEGGLLMDAVGNLYGTTSGAGAFINTPACDNKPARNGCGIVFELTPGEKGKWTETVLHNFSGSPKDGAFPPGGVVMDPSGNLFGITEFGGKAGGLGLGALYELQPGENGIWTETMLHSFPTAENDAYFPIGVPAMDAQGNLYGASELGGVDELGAIWRLKPGKNGDWTESLLYDFGKGGASDAADAYAGVILDAKGNIYGTTVEGGGGCEGFGCGTVYMLANGAHKLTVLLEFAGTVTNSPEGAVMMDAQGNLYGTTAFGGANGNPNCQGILQGCGAVYKLVP
jgi:uncharacterized repeat protein (TIGR03803 family)